MHFFGIKFQYLMALAPFFASAAKAQSLDIKNDTIKSPSGIHIFLPHCTSPNGEEVRYRLRNGQRETGAFNVAISFHTAAAGPMIFLDTNGIEENPEVIRFFAEHECAHHSMGHIQEQKNRHAHNLRLTKEEHFRFEFEADCRAAVAVRNKYGYSRNDIIRIFTPLPPNNESETHPPTSLRLEKALACLPS